MTETTTDTDKRDARELTELLTRQRDTYLRLRELARAQSGAIETQRGESLLRILGDRQRQIGQLTEITRQLEPYRSRWPQLREHLPADQRRRVGDLVAEVQGLLAEILAQDEGDCDTLAQRTRAARDGAAASAVGRRVNAAYAANSYAKAAGGQFIDRTDQPGGTP